MSVCKKLTVRQLMMPAIIVMIIYDVIYYHNHISTDTFFLVPTGEYLLSHGFPETNPWFVTQEPNLPEHPYVIQQWLYCIYLYFIDKIPFGYFLSITAIAVCIVFTVVKLFKMHSCDTLSAIFTAVLGLTMFKSYMLCTRPEALTILLLLLQCLVLEKLQCKNSTECEETKYVYIYYIYIYIIMLAEVNLHSSMWMFHYCIFAAYLVPVPSFLSDICYDTNPSLRFNKHVIGMIAVMTFAVFCSPIGAQSIVYVFDALKSDTFLLSGVTEMRRLSVKSIQGIFVLITAVPAVYACLKKYIRPVSLYISLGFFIMTFMAVRNMMFLFLMIVFVGRDIFSDAKIMDKTLGFKKYSVVSVSFLVYAVITVLIYNNETNDRGFKSEYSLQGMISAVEYITSVEENIADVPVYTDVDTGGYFEYMGFSRIYLDSRPELFNRKGLVDENTSTLEEYHALFVAGEDLRGREYDDTDVAEALARYNFKYFVVNGITCPNLYDYISRNADEYKLVAQCDDNVTVYEAVNYEK